MKSWDFITALLKVDFRSRGHSFVPDFHSTFVQKSTFVDLTPIPSYCTKISFIKAWRKGQPPRSDCVVKLSTGTATAKKDNSKSLASAQSGTNYNSSRATNKLLSCKETPDTTSSPSGPKGQNSDSPRNQPDKSIERIEVGVKVPAVTPSVHESDIKSELSELSSEISLSTAVVNEVKKASTPETLTVKKVSLPPLNYATDSRLSSFSEEKSDRLKVSQVPSTQTIRPVLESDLMVRAVPTPSPDARHAPPPAALPSVPQTPAIPPLSPDPVAIRHNNSLADFAFSPVARVIFVHSRAVSRGQNSISNSNAMVENLILRKNQVQ